MENNYTNLIRTIRTFCMMVEQLESYQRAVWLLEMDHLLERIQEGMAGVDLEVECSYFVLPDLDFRFRLFCRLKAFLGNLDGYALAGDCQGSPEDYSGSLADDFTDIYFDLNRGLDLYDADPADPLSALILWRTGHVLHWQQHLYDARHRLAELRAHQVI